MPQLVATPVVLQAVGNKPKVIEEFVGRPSTGSAGVSVARMRSPGGWEEPGQRPDFEEITLVLRGTLRVDYEGGHLTAGPGQAIVAAAGEWIRYSTPEPEGAEYVAICLPAFAPELAHRDPEAPARR
jgi:ethanolamine utilization protein EutQ